MKDKYSGIFVVVTKARLWPILMWFDGRTCALDATSGLVALFSAGVPLVESLRSTLAIDRDYSHESSKSGSGELFELLQRFNVSRGRRSEVMSMTK